MTLEPPTPSLPTHRSRSSPGSVLTAAAAVVAVTAALVTIVAWLDARGANRRFDQMEQRLNAVATNVGQLSGDLDALVVEVEMIAGSAASTPTPDTETIAALDDLSFRLDQIGWRIDAFADCANTNWATYIESENSTSGRFLYDTTCGQ